MISRFHINIALILSCVLGGFGFIMWNGNIVQKETGCYRRNLVARGFVQNPSARIRCSLFDIDFSWHGSKCKVHEDVHVERGCCGTHTSDSRRYHSLGCRGCSRVRAFCLFIVHLLRAPFTALHIKKEKKIQPDCMCGYIARRVSEAW